MLDKGKIKSLNAIFLTLYSIDIFYWKLSEKQS